MKDRTLLENKCWKQFELPVKIIFAEIAQWCKENKILWLGNIHGITINMHPEFSIMYSGQVFVITSADQHYKQDRHAVHIADPKLFDKLRDQIIAFIEDRAFVYVGCLNQQIASYNKSTNRQLELFKDFKINAENSRTGN